MAQAVPVEQVPRGRVLVIRTKELPLRTTLRRYVATLFQADRIGRLLVLAVLAWPGSGAAQAPETDQLAPVTIDGRTMFRVRGISAFPAAERAAQVADRIRELARDRSFDPSTLELVHGERDSRIGPATRPVVRIFDIDAELEDAERQILAEVYLTRIREAIADYRAVRTRAAMLSAAWRAVLATLLSAAAIFVFWRLRRAIQTWLQRRFRGRVHDVTIRSFEVLRADRIWALVLALLRLALALAILAVVVIYVRAILSVLPWTRGVASQVDDWVVHPLAVLGSGLVAVIPDLVFLAVLFFVTRYLLRLTRLFATSVGRGEVTLGGFDPEWAEPTYKLVRIAMIAFAVIVAYPYIPGSSSAAFKGVSIFMGIVFSLGSSSAISNVIAGYTMVYRRAFREGDRVKVAGVIGDVTRVRLQVTHLRTPKNEDVVIPNSTILSSEIVNYNTLAKDPGLILHTTVGIGYETPWRQVEAMLLEAAARTPGLRPEPKPYVLQLALGDFAVTYEINVYCDDPQAMPRLYTALHRNILDVFNEYGVQIMTPAYEGDPPEPKVVPRDKWHLAPAPGADASRGGD
jgi:small-conductance mechanosensitive channel